MVSHPNQAFLKSFTPRNIIDNRPHLDYDIDLKYPFAQYGQLSLDNEFINGMGTRTIGALALYADLAGTWYFMSLDTGATVHGRTFKPYPAITPAVQERVHAIAMQQKKPKLRRGNFIYEYRRGQFFDDDDAHDEDDDNSDDMFGPPDDEDYILPGSPNDLKMISFCQIRSPPALILLPPML